jgi:hypothetical protein
MQFLEILAVLPSFRVQRGRRHRCRSMQRSAWRPHGTERVCWPRPTFSGM